MNDDTDAPADGEASPDRAGGGSDVAVDPGTWYWDRRTGKALAPRRVDDRTVEFVTVWHAEAVTDALDGGVLVPLADLSLDRTDTTFDLIDSFRTPDIDAGGADGESTDVAGDDPR